MKEQQGVRCVDKINATVDVDWNLHITATFEMQRWLRSLQPWGLELTAKAVAQWKDDGRGGAEQRNDECDGTEVCDRAWGCTHETTLEKEARGLFFEPATCSTCLRC